MLFQILLQDGVCIYSQRQSKQRQGVSYVCMHEVCMAQVKKNNDLKISKRETTVTKP